MGLVLYIAGFVILVYLFFKVRNLEEMLDKQEVEHNELKVSLDQMHEKLDRIQEEERKE
ncbi:hypothetical protein SAMN04487936_10425 [Halobacillus dabanensis]|uniref:Uncharacterized protein n=1 Tax=Halobacillus dabanensis TaxID=240302 RepID=A0A1I3TU48_HALDA|nr:hypothetical protein [Halobacillus dabanensis]SFJ74814.1 hypothetical protein SAMN04487936_10425 [Halobacillus dabanensis]